MLMDVHVDLPNDETTSEIEHFVQGSYQYFHYGCDGYRDKGWGCGYRTLQTLCSWIRLNQRPDGPGVPSIPDIQNLLITIGDKPENFRNSREWIGCIEASHVISTLYGWDCRILHLSSGDKLPEVLVDLAEHLDRGGGPIMAGGDMDCSAKCIVAIRGNYLLIVDPHFYGLLKDRRALQRAGSWVQWQSAHDFLSSSFYNLCLPVPPNRVH